MDEIKPSNRKYPYINWEVHRAPGKDILEVEDLSYVNEQGETLFENVSFTLARGEKMVLIGDDDIAKTKFLECLIGEVKPTKGTIKWGQTVKFTYYPNDNSKYFNENISIIDWLAKWPPYNSTEETKDVSDHRMRSFLGRMLFSNDSVFKKVGITSGGEKARLMFSRMMLLEANFLILDQPLESSRMLKVLIVLFKAYKIIKVDAYLQHITVLWLIMWPMLFLKLLQIKVLFTMAP
nr:ATP-binding cassette domain-containing protein [Mycoplasmopsis bovis]